MRRVVFVILFTVGLEVSAQSVPCSGTDVFSESRKARRIVSDYDGLRAIHQRDLSRLDLLWERQTGRKKRASGSVAGFVAWTKELGYETCTTLGGQPASLNPWTLGALGHARLPFGLSIEAASVVVFERLELQTAAQNASVRADESMLSLRLSLHDWADVQGAWIESEAVQSFPGPDGEEILVGAQTPESETGRLFFAMGVPALSLRTYVIWDPSDVSPATISLGVRDFPILYKGLEATALVEYRGDEQQGILRLGVGNVLDVFSAELGAEHRSVKLRHALLRAELGKSWGWEPEDLAEYAPDQEASPRFAFDAGVWGQATYFNSEYMQLSQGESHLWGFQAGFWASPDITIWVNRIDFSFGLNQPERLEDLSESAGHWSINVQLYSRFGL